MFNPPDIERFRAELHRRGAAFTETAAMHHPATFAAFAYNVLLPQSGRPLLFRIDGHFVGVWNGSTPERASLDDLTDAEVTEEADRALAAHE